MRSPPGMLSPHPPGWWNGRHGALKMLCSKGRAGSSPALGTHVRPRGPGSARPLGCHRDRRRREHPPVPDHEPGAGAAAAAAPDAPTLRPRHGRHPHRGRRGRGADPPRPRRDARGGGATTWSGGRERRAGGRAGRASCGPTWSSSTSRCRCWTASPPPSRSPGRGSPRWSCSPRSARRELVERARDAGAMAYLVKPFTAADLVPAIEIARRRFAELAALEAEVADLASGWRPARRSTGPRACCMTQLGSPSRRRSAGSRRPRWTGA